MDFNIPDEALTVFYPIDSCPSVVPGEHVLVIFEDTQLTSGYWISKLPANQNVNYSNPDDRQTQSGDTSHAFEGDSPSQRRPNIRIQYGGVTTAMTQERQQLIQTIERGTSDSWAQKKILLLGDSQVAGPMGALLGSKLRNHNITSFVREGRVGWGVRSWLSGKLTATSEQLRTFQEVVHASNPDVVIVSLGGNDGSSGYARRSDYESKVRQVWEIATANTSFAIWCGPPTAVGNGASGQPGRDVANQKIKNVVGDGNFVDCRDVTNVTQGRDRLGVHFIAGAAALQPWTDLIIEKGRNL
jgi:hypothetical protein